MRVETSKGHTYELSREAIKRLKAADNGRTADDVYEGFASHVPKSDRLDVWLAVDTVEVW